MPDINNLDVEEMTGSHEPVAPEGATLPSTITMLSAIPKNAIIWILVGMVLAGGGLTSFDVLGGGNEELTLAQEDFNAYVKHHQEVDELHREHMCKRLDEIEKKLDRLLIEK